VNKHNRSALLALTLAIAVCMGSMGTTSAQSPKGSANAAPAFDKLKTLVGRWEANTEKGKATATFESVSGGSALLERVNIHGEETITIYYLDGDRLRLDLLPGRQARLYGAV